MFTVLDSLQCCNPIFHLLSVIGTKDELPTWSDNLKRKKMRSGHDSERQQENTLPLVQPVEVIFRAAQWKLFAPLNCVSLPSQHTLISS